MVNMKNYLKSGVSALTAGALLAGTAAVVPQNGENSGVSESKVSAASTATVDLSKTYQNIRGFGGIDLPEWQGYSLSDAELERAFGNGDGQLGLTVLRLYVNPDKNQWNKCLKTAQYATKAGATIFATPWEPPSSMAESGGQYGKVHLKTSSYAAYAQHLNDFGTYVKNNGVDLYAISVQNEPDYASEWTRWSTNETTDFLANYADKITSTRVMSPESFQYSPAGASWIAGGDGGKTYYQKILDNAKAFANCDVFGTHFYGTTRDWMDFPALEKSGKEIWMTEVYVPNSTANSANNWPEAIQVAENIHNGMVVSNLSAYTWWYIKRSYSLIEQNGTNGAITKRGYMMAQYSKYVRPGYKRTEVTEQPQSNVLVSAYKGDNNKVVIVAINKGSSEVNQQFEVSGQTLTEVVRYRSSSSENLAQSKMSPSGSGFNSQLPANSVSTYVCTISGDHGVDGTGTDGPVISTPVEPDEKGYYFEDTFEDGADSWTARGSVTTELSGRAPYEGKNALVITERTSAWNGIQKDLSSSVFKPGESYAFSACVNILDADVASETVKLTLQYKDSAGESKYANIDSKVCTVGNYVQLYNPNYQIPEGATSVQLVVETDKGTMNFYVDEVIGAVAGTKIDGPAEQPVVTTTVTTTPEPVVTEPLITTTVAPVTEPEPTSEPVVKGDADCNGTVNSSDLVSVIQHLVSKITLTGDSFSNADMNSDGKISIIDLILLKNALS